MNIIDIIKGIWTANPEILKWYLSQGRVILDYFHFFFDKLFYILLYTAILCTMVYLTASLFVIYHKKKYKEKEFIAKKAPFVTIQIPTRNEIVALRCAKKCLAFDYPKDRYEILIGDDSSKPSISAKIKAFAKQYAMIRVIKREKNIGFKPGNLNNMLKYSKGEILVLFDSDFTPERDFLKRIVAPFIHDKKLSAVQARWNFNNFDQNMTTMLASTIVYIFHHIVLSFLKIFGTSSLCGSAEAIRKSDVMELGKWRSGSLTEDIEFTLRLHKNNKKILYLPDLQCYSDVPEIPSDLYKQQMRWAYGIIDSYKIHLKGLIFHKKLNAKKKILSMFAGFGYGMPVLILGLFITGTLSFVTHRPGAIDIPRFVSEMAINIILTSGLIIATFVALYREGKIKYLFKTMVSSFSVGLVTTYYVNKGILKSILGKPMEWYLLKKKTNI